eukprot:533469-Rhodomonas_salina.2
MSKPSIAQSMRPEGGRLPGWGPTAPQPIAARCSIALCSAAAASSLPTIRISSRGFLRCSYSCMLLLEQVSASDAWKIAAVAGQGGSKVWGDASRNARSRRRQ